MVNKKKRLELATKSKEMSIGPGIYKMLDKNNQIIYIGKAKNLRNRVRGYFQDNKDVDPKTRKLVSQVDDFEVVLTDSEAEALILECILIKKIAPNIMLCLRTINPILIYSWIMLMVTHGYIMSDASSPTRN